MKYLIIAVLTIGVFVGWNTNKPAFAAYLENYAMKEIRKQLPSIPFLGLSVSYQGRQISV